MMEKRAGATDLANQGNRLVGYAAVYGPLSEDLGGFRERVAPGAFRRDLESDRDIRALLDHDTAKVLGRRANGTLTLESDERGLRVDIRPPEGVTYSEDLKKLVARGDINQMSFGFMVRKDGDEWERMEDGTRLRILNDLELVEVSVVTIPAYPDTSVALRALHRVETEWRARGLWVVKHRLAPIVQPGK